MSLIKKIKTLFTDKSSKDSPQSKDTKPKSKHSRSNNGSKRQRRPRQDRGPRDSNKEGDRHPKSRHHSDRKRDERPGNRPRSDSPGDRRGDRPRSDRPRTDRPGDRRGDRRDNRRGDRRDNRRGDRPRDDAQKKLYHQEKLEPVKPSGKAFQDFDFHPKVLEKLKEHKFTHATEIQEKSIPLALEGKDLFCSSETGSGKTLSFLLPMIHKFYTNELDQALIICPTREIAIQIQKTLELFNDDDTLSSALVIGGTNMALQKQALQKYPKILVATPGRLLDMLNTGLIWLEYTHYVVLDEADRMLDMGFEEDLIKIHKQLSGKHQTVLFSATLFPEIKKMAKRYSQGFEEIVIGNPTSVAASVTHVLVDMPESQKLEALQYLIRRNPGKMMVFFNTIKDTSNTQSILYRKRVPKVKCIHSKILQSAREQIITDFRAEKIKVLLASDIAARGIDIPNVEVVVNYDVPNNSEEYIHRVGRTGRAGKTGLAISFYSGGFKDKKNLEAIEKLLEGKIQRQGNYKDLL